MDLDRFFTRLNPLVVAALQAPVLGPLLGIGLMTITVTGRRTGRSYTIPVGYQPCEGGVVVLVSKAHRKSWWRNYETPRALRLRLRGRVHAGVGEVVAKDSAEFAAHLEQTFRRLPGISRQFGVTFDRAQGLDARQLAHLREEAAVVKITVQACAAAEMEIPST